MNDNVEYKLIFLPILCFNYHCNFSFFYYCLYFYTSKLSPFKLMKLLKTKARKIIFHSNGVFYCIFQLPGSSGCCHSYLLVPPLPLLFYIFVKKVVIAVINSNFYFNIIHVKCIYLIISGHECHHILQTLLMSIMFYLKKRFMADITDTTLSLLF